MGEPTEESNGVKKLLNEGRWEEAAALAESTGQVAPILDFFWGHDKQRRLRMILATARLTNSAHAAQATHKLKEGVFNFVRGELERQRWVRTEMGWAGKNTKLCAICDARLQQFLIGSQPLEAYEGCAALSMQSFQELVAAGYNPVSSGRLRSDSKFFGSAAQFARLGQTDLARLIDDREARTSGLDFYGRWKQEVLFGQQEGFDGLFHGVILCRPCNQDVLKFLRART